MDRVIHFTYLKGIIPESLITEIREVLAEKEIEFSCEDISGLPQAAWEELVAPLLLVLSSDITRSFLIGLASSAAYDFLKWTVLQIWRNVSGKKIYITYASGDTRAKDADLDLEIRYDGQRIKFRLKGDIPDSLKEKCIEQVFDLAKQRERQSESENEQFRPTRGFIALYDVKKDSWEILEDHDFIAKYVKKKRGLQGGAPDRR